MVQIVYSMLAFAMLYGEIEADARALGSLHIQPLCAAFVTLTNEDEIVGPAEVWDFNHFANEVMLCRGRLDQLASCPRISEWPWPLNNKACQANYHLAMSFLCRFELMTDLEPHRAEYWTELASECRNRAGIWWEASSASDCANCIIYRRNALRRIRELIGPARWASMTLPAPVPLDALPRMD